MKVLVFNVGSSSLKFAVFNMLHNEKALLEGNYQRFHRGQCQRSYVKNGETMTENIPLGSVAGAIANVPGLLNELGLGDFDAVGHRIAHGGDQFQHAVLIHDDILEGIENCTPLAPLHNPSNLIAVRLARGLWPTVPHVAVFDTAFHQSIPHKAYTYALPKEWQDIGLRRYGFHGTSHQYVSQCAAKYVDRHIGDLKIISCHLGSGASVCAIDQGLSLDTSMGMTPLEGLVMGTRSGDIDPGLFGYLKRSLGLSVEQIEESLYKESGMQALTGTEDLRDIEKKRLTGDINAQLALDIYAYRVKKYIGAYAAAMNGLDILLFTGGVGENSSLMRRLIAENFEFLHLYLDHKKNQSASFAQVPIQEISTSDSKIKVLAVQTEEQWMIAREVQSVLEPCDHHFDLNIPVSVSARHLHLCQEDVEVLFGQHYQLRKKKDLMQSEAWVAEETVELVGPEGSFDHVRILGPARSSTQIEISRIDALKLGMNPPVRSSGVLHDTPKVLLKGPAGELETNGLILASRHIHMNTDDAIKMNLKEGDYVDVRIKGDYQEGVLTRTRIFTKKTYVTEMHIDTDEAKLVGIAKPSKKNTDPVSKIYQGKIKRRLPRGLSE